MELSTEQRYLYDMCVSIRSGNCSEGLSKRDSGKLVHSRWLTTVNRILRLYVATSNPDQNLVPFWEEFSEDSEKNSRFFNNPV